MALFRIPLAISLVLTTVVVCQDFGPLLDESTIGYEELQGNRHEDLHRDSQEKNETTKSVVDENSDVFIDEASKVAEGLALAEEDLIKGSTAKPQDQPIIKENEEESYVTDEPGSEQTTQLIQDVSSIFGTEFSAEITNGEDISAIDSEEDVDSIFGSTLPQESTEPSHQTVDVTSTSTKPEEMVTTIPSTPFKMEENGGSTIKIGIFNRTEMGIEERGNSTSTTSPDDDSSSTIRIHILANGSLDDVTIGEEEHLVNTADTKHADKEEDEEEEPQSIASQEFASSTEEYDYTDETTITNTDHEEKTDPIHLLEEGSHNEETTTSSSKVEAFTTPTIGLNLETVTPAGRTENSSNSGEIFEEDQVFAESGSTAKIWNVSQTLDPLQSTERTIPTINLVEDVKRETTVQLEDTSTVSFETTETDSFDSTMHSTPTQSTEITTSSDSAGFNEVTMTSVSTETTTSFESTQSTEITMSSQAAQSFEVTMISGSTHDNDVTMTPEVTESTDVIMTSETTYTTKTSGLTQTSGATTIFKLKESTDTTITSEPNGISSESTESVSRTINFSNTEPALASQNTEETPSFGNTQENGVNNGNESTGEEEIEEIQPTGEEETKEIESKNEESIEKIESSEEPDKEIEFTEGETTEKIESTEEVSTEEIQSTDEEAIKQINLKVEEIESTEKQMKNEKFTEETTEKESTGNMESKGEVRKEIITSNEEIEFTEEPIEEIKLTDEDLTEKTALTEEKSSENIESTEENLTEGMKLTEKEPNEKIQPSEIIGSTEEEEESTSIPRDLSETVPTEDESEGDAQAIEHVVLNNILETIYTEEPEILEEATRSKVDEAFNERYTIATTQPAEYSTSEELTNDREIHLEDDTNDATEMPITVSENILEEDEIDTSTSSEEIVDKWMEEEKVDTKMEDEKLEEEIFNENEKFDDASTVELKLNEEFPRTTEIPKDGLEIEEKIVDDSRTNNARNFKFGDETRSTTVGPDGVDEGILVSNDIPDDDEDLPEEIEVDKGRDNDRIYEEDDNPDLESYLVPRKDFEKSNNDQDIKTEGINEDLNDYDDESDLEDKADEGDDIYGEENKIVVMVSSRNKNLVVTTESLERTPAVTESKFFGEDNSTATGPLDEEDDYESLLQENILNTGEEETGQFVFGKIVDHDGKMCLMANMTLKVRINDTNLHIPSNARLVGSCLKDQNLIQISWKPSNESTQNNSVTLMVKIEGNTNTINDVYINITDTNEKNTSKVLSFSKSDLKLNHDEVEDVDREEIINLDHGVALKISKMFVVVPDSTSIISTGAKTIDKSENALATISMVVGGIGVASLVIVVIGFIIYKKLRKNVFKLSTVE